MYMYFLFMDAEENTRISLKWFLHCKKDTETRMADAITKDKRMLMIL